jgi:repressor LexA
VDNTTDADGAPANAQNRVSENAARKWRDLGPAARDAITTSTWCSHCRTAVEIVDYHVGEVAEDLLLRGKCRVCGGPVARHVERPNSDCVPYAAPAQTTPTAVESDPFPGLESVAASRLTDAGLRNRQEVLAAIDSGKLSASSPDRPRQYGRIHHQRVLQWLDLPVAAPLPLPAGPGFTAKQGQYLAFIHYYTKINHCPPAEADFQRYFRVSPPTVHAMLVALQDRGWISRVPGRARSITLNLTRDSLPDLE